MILVILVYSFGVVTTQLVIEHCRDLAVEALQDAFSSGIRWMLQPCSFAIICRHPELLESIYITFSAPKVRFLELGTSPPQKKPAPGAMVRTPTQSQSALSRCPAIGPALGPATRRQEMGPWGYPVVQLAIEKCHSNI